MRRRTRVIHGTGKRRHFVGDAENVANDHALRAGGGIAQAVRFRIAIALPRTGTFAIPAARSGNKIVCRNAAGNRIGVRLPAADDRLRDVLTTLHAHILPPLGRCWISHRNRRFPGNRPW